MVKIGQVLMLTYKGVTTVRRAKKSDISDRIVLVNDELLKYPVGQNYDAHELSEKFIYANEIDKYKVTPLGNVSDKQLCEKHGLNYN
jgi:hypothetical protein